MDDYEYEEEFNIVGMDEFARPMLKNNTAVLTEIVLNHEDYVLYSRAGSCKYFAECVHAENQSWKIWKKRRYIVGIMGALGFFNVYCLRVNMSMAIVAMTENKTITLENGTQITEPEFNWDNTVQSIILSSFFYGYITTQLLGGYVASRFGGRLMFGVAVAVTAGLTLITPWLAKTHVNLLIAVRIVEGIFEGVTYPCMHAIWAKWAPPFERARLTNIAFSGAYLGTVFSMPVCAVLSDALGWESIFYFFGFMGLIWFVCWMVFVADSPEKDKWISLSELKYMSGSLHEANSTKQGPIPWKGILTSVPVWAIIISNFSENWGFYTLLTYLPKYLKDTLNYDLSSSGFLSALPYLTTFIVLQFSGRFADWFLVKGILTTTQVRRIFTCGAFVSQTVFMMAAAYWADRIGTVFCLTMAVGLGAFSWAGFGANYLEVGPQYAGVLMGLGNTFASSPGIITPILTGYIVKSPPTVLQWQTVFYIAGGVYLFGAIIYGIFGSGHIQSWAIKSQPSEPLPEENIKGAIDTNK